MKLLFIIALILLPNVSYAEECDDNDCYIEMKEKDDEYRIIDGNGKEIGRIINDTYTPPKYMPYIGKKDNTNITIHIPSDNDLLQ